MLVDDDPNSAYILSMIMKLNEIEVVPFTDPELALANFDKSQYDLVLLDIRMPRINGFELYKKMMEIDKKVKVCFMTNYTQEYRDEFQKTFPSLSSASFVDKPISGNDLLKILQMHMT